MSSVTIDGPLIDKNPLDLVKILNKYATVSLIKNVNHAGFVQNIDPVSGSVILQQTKDEGVTILLPGFTIQSITFKEDEVQEESPESVAIDGNTRRKLVLEWLIANLLPVEDVDGVLKLGDMEIHPPYRHCDIFTDNLLVHSQISDLMKKMPLPEI